MSHKRRREETSEQIHTRHKKLKDDHGVPHRVDPQRFSKANQTFNFGSEGATLHQDPFSMPLPSDEDTNDHHQSMTTHQQSEDTEFGLLLYELASLDVGHHKQEAAEQPQTCPICSSRVSLKEFPDHVHHCLDRMDTGDRNSMKSQVELDSDFATEYALKHGYVTDYAVSCPICGQQLLFGTGMNEHVNQCVDESEKKQQENMEDDEDDDMNQVNSNSKVEVLSREQMIECASKLMTLQKGSEQFDNMLDMFGALGFNKKNVKSVLQIEKNAKQSNSNGNNTNSNNANGAREMSPVAEEEDVDLFGNDKYEFDDADL
eukprot:250872_1